MAESLLKAAEAAIQAVEGGPVDDDAVEKSDVAKPSSTLFIRGLHPSTTSKELEDVFSDLGPLRNAFVVKRQSDEEQGDDKTESNRGIGFVTFALQEDATKAFEQAIPKNGGVKVRAKLVRVEYAQPKPSRKERAQKVKNGEAKVRPEFPTKKRKHETADDTLPRKEHKVDPAQRRDPNAPNTVILVGLPPNLTKKVIYKKARKLGDVREIVFPLDEDTSKASVITSSPYHAAQVCQKLDQHTFKGQKISATIKVKPRVPDQALAPLGKESRLIARNLPFGTTVAFLQTLFEKYGKVIQVDLPTLATSQDAERTIAAPKIRGFAFIWMSTVQEANAAIAGLNRASLNPSGKPDRERVIAVDFALSKKAYEEAEKVQVAPVDPTTEQDSHPEAPDALGDAGDSESDAADEMGASTKDKDEMDIEVDEEQTDDESERDRDEPSTESTIFIRNLLFESTEDSVYQLFRSFGPLRYARITTDYATGRSRGTAFVCFHRQSDAEKCLEEAEMVAQSADADQSIQTKTKNPFKMPSVLSVFSNDDDLQAKFTLDGRVLKVTRAVSRDQADELKVKSEKTRKAKDKRNTYLMKEGVIFTNSNEAKDIPAIEVEKRMASYNTRKKLLASNPSLYISKTRLSLRQIPLYATSQHLKKLAIFASKAFRNQVKEGTREPLTDDEIADAKTVIDMKFSTPGAVKQVKLMRSQDRIDLISGLGKSRGYGFVEMRSHAEALMVLRWVNNNPEANALLWQWFKEDLKNSIKAENKGKDEEKKDQDKERLRALIARAKEADSETGAVKTKQRIIVEFSIENIVTVKRLEKRNSAIRANSSKSKVSMEGTEQPAETGTPSTIVKANANANPKLGIILARRRRDKKAKMSS